MLFLAFVFQCVLFWLLKSQVICFVMLINEKSALEEYISYIESVRKDNHSNENDVVTRLSLITENFENYKE